MNTNNTDLNTDEDTALRVRAGIAAMAALTALIEYTDGPGEAALAVAVLAVALGQNRKKDISFDDYVKNFSTQMINLKILDRESDKSFEKMASIEELMESLKSSGLVH